MTLGILTGYYTTTSFLGLWVLFVLLGGLVLVWITTRKNIQPGILFGALAYSTFFLLGYVNYKLRLPEFQPSHISHFIEKDSFQLVRVKIKEVLKPNNYRQNYIAEVRSVGNYPSTGNILVSVKKDSVFEPFFVDEEVLVSAKIRTPFSPKNPFVFDYSKYLKKLGVHQQVSISIQDVLIKNKGSTTLKGLAEQYRNHIIQKLKENRLTKDELAIIEALLLGQRKDISKELYIGYQRAGATHILAVSGLHVGIILLLVSFLLKPLHSFKRGKTIALILTVVLLWGFALLAGLSASVVRAVTMFSFLVFAQVLNRETNAINTLFLSYFFLLLLNPSMLFQTGFQLSYVAVFFILWVHPKLYAYYRPRFYIDKLLWGIFSVTLVVQIGILPLLLYYFHQFPGLSFITNLVVLPFLGIILGIGVLIIVLALLNGLPHFLSEAFNTIIELLNRFIIWVGSQEQFIISHISFSGARLWATYGLIVSVIIFWKKPSAKKINWVLAAIAMMLWVHVYEKIDHSTNEWVVFHKPRKTLMVYKHNQTLLLFSSDTLSKYTTTSPVKEYSISKAIKTNRVTMIPAVFEYNNKRVVVLDSLGVFPLRKVDVVILTQSPKVHLDIVLDNLQPSIVVADGSNYFTYIQRWEKTCKRRKLPFHYTGTKGAFILE